MSEGMIQFATSQQQQHDLTTVLQDRKEKGHFGTSPAIAEFMADMFPMLPKGNISILDPGAGVGTLTAALCDRISRLRSPRSVNVQLWENDPSLMGPLQNTMRHCQRVLRSQGYQFQFTIHTDDFVLANAQSSLFSQTCETRFDLVIMNPPYFKLRKNSEQAQAMHHVVHGQPNIYAFFMALGAKLLKPDGLMVAITPRSYFNGPYFRKFRNWFLSRITPIRIHLFDSRTDVFENDDVLQENVILCAQKTEIPQEVILTSSSGKDFYRDLREFHVPYSKVIENSSGDRIIRVTTCPLEQQLIDYIDTLPSRLIDLGLKISTGPVVSFRATDHLLHEQDVRNSAPMLWLHNVRPFTTQFSTIKKKLASHIRVSQSSLKLLLPAKRYVLLKRFTSKEEKRRLVAGIFESQNSYSPYIGIENHLNYIHKPNDELTQSEALGLAAILNSLIIDRYFRAISGNTQVNATEIRNLPLPNIETVAEIGAAVMETRFNDETEFEYIVGRSLSIPEELITSLREIVV